MGEPCPSMGFDDFLMIIGCTASSSTFFSVGRVEMIDLKVGGRERVGLNSKSNWIYTSKIWLLIGACELLGFILRLASMVFYLFFLRNSSSLATIKSKASKSYPRAIL